MRCASTDFANSNNNTSWLVGLLKDHAVLPDFGNVYRVAALSRAALTELATGTLRFRSFLLTFPLLSSQPPPHHYLYTQFGPTISSKDLNHHGSYHYCHQEDFRPQDGVERDAQHGYQAQIISPRPVPSIYWACTFFVPNRAVLTTDGTGDDRSSDQSTSGRNSLGASRQTIKQWIMAKVPHTVNKSIRKPLQIIRVVPLRPNKRKKRFSSLRVHRVKLS